MENLSCFYTSPLHTSFYQLSTAVVARELLGKILVWHQPVRYSDDHSSHCITLAGRIVETEAYLHKGDAASHSARGCTDRNKAMFAKGGIMYIYKIYGIHHCINVVTEDEGKGCAVLIRAVEPLLGIALMQQQRGTQDVRRLCNGPGNLAQAFGFSLVHNGLSLCSEALSIQDAERIPDAMTLITTRVGITKDAHLPLRFCIRGNPYVSKGKPS